jgi:pilus assembly protein CpaF
MARLSDGTRKITNISEITGMEGDMVCMQDIFVFERHGISETGKVKGVFKTTGIRPKFAERLLSAGLRLPAQLFDSEVEV